MNQPAERMRELIAAILADLNLADSVSGRLLNAAVESLRALSSADLRQIKRFLHASRRTGRGFAWFRRFADDSSQSRDRRIAIFSRALTRSTPAVRLFLRSLIRQMSYLEYAGTSSESPEPAIWRELGYTLLKGGDWEADEVLVPARVRVSQSTFAADYLVIGSGAGGSVTAAELAETGKRILVVDAGPLPTPGELGQSEDFAQRHWSEIHGAISTPSQPVVISSGRVFGGGTVLSWGSCVDPPLHVLRLWGNRFGFVDCQGESFRHSLYSVRRRMGIDACPETSRNNEALRAGCDRLAWKTAPLERNQGSCRTCATCSFGCASGKQDALRTYLLDSSRLGVHLLPNCRISHFEFSDGVAIRAMGTLRDQAGADRNVEFRFRHAILSAGAIHTPAILLRSGLKNPHLGQHLQLQPSILVLGEFAEAIEAWNGAPQTLTCLEFAAAEAGTSFRLESAPLHPGFLAMNLPWRSPEHLRRTMSRARFMAGILVTIHDQEEHLGQIELDSQGRLQIRYQPSLAVIRAIAEGCQAAQRCLRAAGATRLYSPIAGLGDFVCSHEPEAFADYCRQVNDACRDYCNLTMWSAHPSSTCRIGSSIGSAASDLAGRAFGAKNVFVCDASSLPTSVGVPPILTISTLAHYLSQKIKRLTA